MLALSRLAGALRKLSHAPCACLNRPQLCLIGRADENSRKKSHPGCRLSTTAMKTLANTQLRPRGGKRAAAARRPGLPGAPSSYASHSFCCNCKPQRQVIRLFCGPTIINIRVQCVPYTCLQPSSLSYSSTVLDRGRPCRRCGGECIPPRIGLECGRGASDDGRGGPNVIWVWLFGPYAMCLWHLHLTVVQVLSTRGRQ